MVALSIEDTPTPKLVPDARTPAEYSRLELLLAERARELQQHRHELARLKALLRDATADFERALSAAEPLDNVELTRQRDAAVVRALEAETARAEALFRLDEVMGHLAEASPGGLLSREPDELTTLQSGTQALADECARLGDAVRRLEGELAASRSECRQAGELRENTRRELAAALERAQGLERELAAGERAQQRAGGLAEALQETRQVLGEFARAVERVARRESSLDASLDPKLPSAGA